MATENREPIGYSWSFRDLLISLMVVFLALAIILFAVPMDTKKAETVGPMLIEMSWDSVSNSDIDLWVRPPHEESIGYSHKNGILCDLVRDDLGKSGDSQSNNTELTICRSAAPGTWIVDAMAYHVYDNHFPIHVRVRITRYGGPYEAKEILEGTVELHSQGEIQTVFQFDLDSKGKLIPDSVNHVQADLRTESP